MDRGAWQATVHGVTKSWTQLSVCAHRGAHTHTHTEAQYLIGFLLMTQMGGVEQVTYVLAAVTSLRPCSRKFCYFVSNPCLSFQENITEQVNAFR